MHAILPLIYFIVLELQSKLDHYLRPKLNIATIVVHLLLYCLYYLCSSSTLVAFMVMVHGPGRVMPRTCHIDGRRTPMTTSSYLSVDRCLTHSVCPSTVAGTNPAGDCPLPASRRPTDDGHPFSATELTQLMEELVYVTCHCR